MSAKKIFSTCLALIFATTIFSGCSSTQVAAGGGGGGLTIIVVFELLDHFSSFALNSEAIMKKYFGDDDETKEKTVKAETKTVKAETKNPDVKITEVKAETEQPKVQNQSTAKLEKINSEQSVTNEQKSVSNEKKTEPTQKIVPTKRNVTYERFTDSVFGFSFDYPAAGAEDIIVKKDLDNKPTHPSSARWHIINFANSSISMGSDFTNDMERMKNLNLNEHFYVNLNIRDLGNNVYLVTWTDKRYYRDVILKNFFGINNHYDRKERHFIEYTYNYDTSEEEKQIAQHMINSFQSGFNK